MISKKQTDSAPLRNPTPAESLCGSRQCVEVRSRNGAEQDNRTTQETNKPNNRIAKQQNNYQTTLYIVNMKYMIIFIHIYIYINHDSLI